MPALPATDCTPANGVRGRMVDRVCGPTNLPAYVSLYERHRAKICLWIARAPALGYLMMVVLHLRSARHGWLSVVGVQISHNRSRTTLGPPSSSVMHCVRYRTATGWKDWRAGSTLSRGSVFINIATHSLLCAKRDPGFFRAAEAMKRVAADPWRSSSSSPSRQLFP